MALRSTPLQDQAALTYDEFVAARWTALYRTAYLLTASHADAEDLAQTALVKTYLAWPKVLAADSPDAYVRRILTNVFLSGRRPLRVVKEQLTDQPPEVGTASLENHDRLALWPHISALPPKQRAVIVLRYYEDLSEQQIADTLGCSPGTVKSTASDALRSLRSRIGSTEGASS